MTLPRFSLRTLFVLTAAASIPMGWVAYQLNWIRQRHAVLANVHTYEYGEWLELRNYLSSLGFKATSSDIPSGIVFGRTYSVQALHWPTKTAPWSLRLFGESPSYDLWLGLNDSDPELARIRALFPECQVAGLPYYPN